MASTEPETLTIAETLASTRGGVIIRATAIPDLTNYMQDVLGLGSGKDVFEELDVDGFIGCFTAAEVYEDEVVHTHSVRALLNRAPPRRSALYSKYVATTARPLLRPPKHVQTPPPPALA